MDREEGPGNDPHEEELKAPLVVLAVIAAFFLLGLILLAATAFIG